MVVLWILISLSCLRSVNSRTIRGLSTCLGCERRSWEEVLKEVVTAGLERRSKVGPKRISDRWSEEAAARGSRVRRGLERCKRSLRVALARVFVTHVKSWLCLVEQRA